MTGPAPLMDPERIGELTDLLGRLDADAWLLYDFQGQNPVAHRLLGLGKTTRRAFALLPRAGGAPVVLHHRIEASAWTRWPWERRTYSGWRELSVALEELLHGTSRVAMEISPSGAIPTVDRVPAGVVELVREAGVEVVSSGDLITAFSRWTPEGLAAHRRAAHSLRTVALEAFRRAAQAAHRSEPITDAELMAWILGRLRDRGLTDQTGTIVAAGARAADPHYHPRGKGQPIPAGSLVLIDLWGRHPRGGIPGDQTWMGYLGQDVPDRVQAVWEAVRDARDRALVFLADRWASGQPVRGWEVDRAARSMLEERGLARYFVHRLGHSIDADLHGSGPNLDHLETQDDRHLLPGIGFSVEPGVYIPGELGVRTEVNVYWGDDGPEVTPEEPQHEILRFPAADYR